MSTLENKKMIITGASKGLGAVAARAFAAQGAQVVLMARSEERLEQIRQSCHNPALHLSLPIDLMEMQSLSAAVEQAIDFLGGVDAVLHSAGGGLGFRDPLLGTDEFLQLFLLNFGAAAEINRLVVPEMKKRRSGYLVHVGSIASNEAIGSVGYNTVKAGLAAYVRSLGRELAPFHIVVSGIMPGGFTAPGNAMERLAEKNPDAYREFVEERLPRRVMGRAEELLPLLQLLCSEAGAMMGGCMVPIDAGEGKAYHF